MNKLFAVGTIISDINYNEYNEGNTKKATFIMSCTENYKNKEGFYASNQFPVTAWGHKAEIISKHFSKGDPIGMVAKVTSEKYEDENGKISYPLNIVLDEFHFIPLPKKKAVQPKYEEYDPSNMTAEEALERDRLIKEMQEKFDNEQ